MPLYDTCGHPMERGAMRRVGPTRQYFHGARAGTPASIQARNNKIRSGSTVFGSTSGASRQQRPAQQLRSQSSLDVSSSSRNPNNLSAGSQQKGGGDPRCPDMTKHRKQKLETGWYESKMDPCIGPHGHTVQRSFQMTEERRLAENLYDVLREKEQSIARDRGDRDVFRAQVNSLELQSVRRLGTPEKEDAVNPSVDWTNFAVGKKSHGYAPSTAVSTEFANGAQVSRMKNKHLENERRKRNTEIVRTFNDHRNPVQCSQLFGTLPNERVAELSRNRKNFKRDVVKATAEVERVAFEEEYNRLIHQQKHNSGNPDFDRCDVMSLETGTPASSVKGNGGGNHLSKRNASPARNRDAITFNGQRPSEKHLGTIPVSKAYPYQRQLHMRRQLDEFNMKQSMIGAIDTMGNPRHDGGASHSKSGCVADGGGGGVDAFYEVAHISPARRPKC